MASSKRSACRSFALISFTAVAVACATVQAQTRATIYASTGAVGSPPAGRASGSSGRSQGQGYFGIKVRDVSDSEVGTLHLKSAHGAEVVMVDHDSPAGKAGLRAGDVILSVNGATVDDEDAMHRILRDLQPGRAVSLNVCRGGTEQTVNATMANRAELERQAWEQHWVVPEPAPAAEEPVAAAPASSSRGFGHGFISGHLLSLTPTYTGATVDAMGAQLADFFGVKDGKALLVHEVDSNSPAALAGLRAGDVITRMNGGRVTTKSDWTRALHDSKGHPVSLTVVRDRHEQTLTMVPDARHRSAVEQPPPPEDGHGWMTMLLQ